MITTHEFWQFEVNRSLNLWKIRNRGAFVEDGNGLRSYIVLSTIFPRYQKVSWIWELQIHERGVTPRERQDVTRDSFRLVRCKESLGDGILARLGNKYQFASISSAAHRQCVPGISLLCDWSPAAFDVIHPG